MKTPATVLLLALVLGAAAPAQADGMKETPTMNKKAPPGASRPAPPQVMPVEHAGVRYQEDDDALRHGGNQGSGYLVATDTATGQRLWHLKVYEVPTATRPGAPNFGRHFRRMTLADGGNALEVENEVGGVYRVDLSTRTSTWVSGPDSKRE